MKSSNLARYWLKTMLVDSDLQREMAADSEAELTYQDRKSSNLSASCFKKLKEIDVPEKQAKSFFHSLQVQTYRIFLEIDLTTVFPELYRTFLGSPRFDVTTQFPGLYQSNFPLDDRQAQLRVLRRSIVSLEAEILVLERKLSAQDFGKHPKMVEIVLRDDLERARSLLFQHLAILSPIRQLPYEILEKVFYHTIPEVLSPDDLSHRARFPSDLPWAISQVCRLWRHIALSISALWAHLPTIYLSDFRRNPKRHLAFLTELLKRSRNSLIAFELICPYNWTDFRRDVQPFMDLLVLHSDRWQNISLVMPSKALCSLDGAKNCIPVLRTLHWRAREDEPDQRPPEEVFDLFLNAPQLRNVDVSHLPTQELLLPSLRRLVHNQNGGKTNQFMQALKHSSSSLRRLEIDGVDSAETRGLEETISLPRLSALKIGKQLGNQFFQEALLGHLLVPALEELQVNAETSFVLPSLCNILIHSLPASPGGASSLLTKLYLRTTFIPGQLADILLLTPLLTHLNVTGPSTVDLQLLSFEEGDKWAIVPRLQVCAFSYTEAHIVQNVEEVQLFALARCELRFGIFGEPTSVFSRDGYHDIDLDSTRNMNRLGALYVVGPTQVVQQIIFEGWNQTENVIKLNDLTTQISESFRIREKDRKPEIIAKYNFLLGLVEDLEIQRADEIYQTGILGILRHMVNQGRFDNNRPPTDWERALAIAERIYKKWTPLMQSSLDTLQWVVYGKGLVYISSSNALRTSRNRMKMVYGLSRLYMEPSDRIWPKPRREF